MYYETVDTCAAHCSRDKNCVSFIWNGRQETNARCMLTNNCASGLKASFYASKRNDLYVKEMFAHTAAPTSSPTLRPTLRPTDAPTTAGCVRVERVAGWSKPTSCDLV